MTQIAAPRFDAPVGFAQVGNARVPVLLSREYIRFFEAWVARMGGTSGSDLGDVTEDLRELQGVVHGRRALVATETRAGDGLNSAAVAGGAVFSVNPLHARAFAQRPSTPRGVDDAEAVLAQRSFARR